VSERTAWTVATTLLLIFGCAFSSATQQTSKSGDSSAATFQAPQTGKAKPDLGSVSDNVYTNDSLGMKYEFPKGWFVDKDIMNLLNDQPNGPKPTGNTSQFVDEYPAISTRETLLVVSQQSPEPDCDGCPPLRMHNPRIFVYANVVTPTSSIQTLADGQKKIKSKYETIHTAQIIRELPDCSYGGQTFYRIDMKWLRLSSSDPLFSGFAYTSDVITIRKGYLMAFSIFADSPEQLNQLLQTLNSLSFK